MKSLPLQLPCPGILEMQMTSSLPTGTFMRTKPQSLLWRKVSSFRTTTLAGTIPHLAQTFQNPICHIILFHSSTWQSVQVHAQTCHQSWTLLGVWLLLHGWRLCVLYWTSVRIQTHFVVTIHFLYTVHNVSAQDRPSDYKIQITARCSSFVQITSGAAIVSCTAVTSELTQHVPTCAAVTVEIATTHERRWQEVRPAGVLN